MRPLRLELEGFSSFREPAVIDFRDADLFVLTGPTGAGKSSIIDAITFALYGLVPRFDSNQSAAPVITQGGVEARVKLDFAVGEVEYRIARTLQRAPNGRPRPARVSLERGEETIASAVREADAAIADILGLGFEEFTKCVVLPQGDFAELLHAKSSDRRDLLIRLLDFGLYRKVGERARGRASEARLRLAGFEERLRGDLADATPENLATTAARHRAVHALSARLEAEQGALTDLEMRAAQEVETVRARQAEAQVLRELRTPAEVPELDERLKAAEARLATALHDRETAAAALTDAQATQESLPARARIEAMIERYAVASAVAAQLVAARGRLAELETAETTAATKAVAARAAGDTAQARHQTLLRGDAAYHAASGLAAGDACPVCGGVLSSAPLLVAPAGLAEAEKAAARAVQLTEQADRAANAAASTTAAQRGAVEQLVQREAEATAALAGALSLVAAQEELARIDGATAALEQARAEHHAAEVLVAGATRARADLGAARESAWSVFHAARDHFAHDGAPAGDPTDLVGSWMALVAWAGSAAAERQTAAEAANRAAHTLRAEGEQRIEAQRAACAEAGIEMGGRAPRDAVVFVSGQLDTELRMLEGRIAQRAEVEAARADAQLRHDRAGTLARHFDRRDAAFEGWFLGEAMQELCAIASRQLEQLTNGTYALTVNEDNDFFVIDRANADTRRPVKTLSGGETFLASLSLALALSEQVAHVSPQGAAHLESLFLDEGFGTLDPETLEVVCGAIAELGARGRMVGIITHVRELAEQIPVQFRVTKDGRTSRVERVAV
jgi:exonuclease SbcC